MSARRDILILSGLFLALVLFIAFGPGRQPPPPVSAPTTHSSSEEGAQALYEWVGKMGYDADRLEYRDFTLETGDSALFILSPPQAVTPEQARTTLAWVEQGGTLILADDTSALLGDNNALLDELMVDITVYTGTLVIDQAAPLQPILDQPPVGSAMVHAGRVLVPQRTDYAALLGTPEHLLVAGIRHGAGYVYISATSYPFTNGGLRDQQNARFVLNMLRRVPAGGRVLFDELHHGYVQLPTTTTTVLVSPWGWAGMYAILAIAAYLVLSGRRFGRPIPLAEETERRSSAEYIESMADMLQRGGKRAYVLNHYHQSLKRRLARSSGINPSVADADFVRELARVRDIDQPALLALLARLCNQQSSEEAMIKAISEAEALIPTNHKSAG
jgi:hypothetical protein